MPGRPLPLSSRTRAMRPSATMAFNDRMMALKRRDPSAVDFGVGEPDLPTPEHVKEAARRALAEDRTRYTPAGGIPELREAVRAKFKRDNGLDYGPDEVTVAASGAKQVIAMGLLALCEPGDEVLVPAPYWVSFADQIRFAGAEPVPVPCRPEERYVPQADDLAERVTERTRALILNSPNNPTGAVYPRAELGRIADACVERSVAIINDGLYETLVYGGAEHAAVASLGDEARALTLTVGGLSKSHCMTGWRIGFGGGPAELIGAITKMNGNLATCANSIAQWAAVAALTGPQEPVRAISREFAARRDLAVSLLREVEGVSLVPPDGAFYAYLDVSGVLGREAGGRVLRTDADVSDHLIDEARVGLIPSAAFGDEGHLRLAFTTSRERIEEGIRRMGAALSRLEGEGRRRHRRAKG